MTPEQFEKRWCACQGEIYSPCGCALIIDLKNVLAGAVQTERTIWMKHLDHIERGEYGEEKTIGSDFFRPDLHCSLCYKK